MPSPTPAAPRPWSLNAVTLVIEDAAGNPVAQVYSLADGQLITDAVNDQGDR